MISRISRVLVVPVLLSFTLLFGCATSSSVGSIEPDIQEVAEEPMEVPSEPVSAENATWLVYDGSVLPSENDPAFHESNTKGLLGESTIVSDPDVAGNSLLQFLSPVGADNKLCWTYDFGMDQAIGATIVFRAKAVEGNPDAMAFDIEFRSGEYRDRLIAFEDGTIKLDKSKVSGTIEALEWNIIRVVLSETAEGTLAVDVYVNEDPTALLSGVSAESHGDNLFRFADGSGNDYAASLYDWVVWTTDGAYGPGEWLPADL